MPNDVIHATPTLRRGVNHILMLRNCIYKLNDYFYTEFKGPTTLSTFILDFVRELAV